MKYTNTVIGLIGKKESGKSEVAKILAEYGYMEISFAAKLKQVCSIMFDIPEWYFHNPKLKDVFVFQDFTPRKIMQTMGTEIGRHLSKSLWIMHVEKFIERYMPPKYGVVVTDVRYENEAFCVRDHGGELWRIVRPDTLTNDLHSSETEQDTVSCDLTIHNDGSLQQLRVKVIHVLSRL